MKQLSIILLTLSLAACGGSGSPTTAASDAKASSNATTAADTPMSTLVVPETMKWVTSSEPSLNISVRDDKNAAAAGASVSAIAGLHLKSGRLRFQLAGAGSADLSALNGANLVAPVLVPLGGVGR